MIKDLRLSPAVDENQLQFENNYLSIKCQCLKYCKEI